jgi:hypothetical protein
MLEKKYIDWCREHLSSEGVLWQDGHEDDDNWIFYFRDSEDAVLFKLTFGG